MPQLTTDHATDRVRAHTSPVVNAKIDRQLQARLQQYADAPPVEIGRRLAELDREWDIDRALMANFAIAGGFALMRGLKDIGRPRLRLRRSSPWLKLIRVQLSFLGLHAVVGWCPPVVLFRRLGFRTQREIATERGALEGLLASRA
jgi:hypothetical protein